MTRNYTIVTPRLHLHALTRAEIELLINAQFDQVANLRHISIPPAWHQANVLNALPLITTDMARSVSDERWVWIICETTSQTLIGDIGFHQPLTSQPPIEVGYAIIEQFQGRGYATEAARALLQWAFAQPEPQRIIARVSPENVASQKVALAAGMQQCAAGEEGFLVFERER
jgi:[ribosomal protein S5]-alanine N-acetyltransferase